MINHFDWVAKWAVYSPNKVAIKEFESGKSLTYYELNKMGNRLAHIFTDQYGIEKGDRVAIIAENCLEYLILFVAAQKTGFVLVPYNYRLAGSEIEFLIDNTKPKLLLCEVKFKHKIQDSEAIKMVPYRLSIKELSTWFIDKEALEGDSSFDNCTIEEDDPIFILYSSGTTGFPKGVIYTHKMLFWNSINTKLSLVINSESRTINCMPPFHTGGWNVLTTPLLHSGGYTCLIKSFDPLDVLQLIEQEQVTILMCVPTMLKMISDLPEFNHSNLQSLYYILVGGESTPVSLIEKWHKKGIPIRQGFGMTEVGPNLTSLHERDAIRKIGSIGRPNFYVKIKIVDDNGNQCKVDEPGELLFKGPMVTPGYWANDDETQKAFKGGWFKSGDRVKEDEEGYLFVIDRIKNMFISGGENVYPAEVERIILQNENVEEAVIVGIPHKKWGEVGKAFIVSKTTINEKDILSFCNNKLAKFKIPKEVVFVDKLPKNDAGKIQRSMLK